METKKTTHQTTPTPPVSGQSGEGYLLEKDPNQEQEELEMLGQRAKPVSRAEIEDFLSKSGETSSAAPVSEALSEGEIRHLQERFPGLSREKALAMARAFGA